MNTVYGVALSPYVRKVLWALEFKQAEYRVETVVPFQAPSSHFQRHPQGKVPCLEDEYVLLPDSAVICQYVDEKYPGNSYYPRDFREKARALWLEKFADTALAEVFLMFWLQRQVRPVLLNKPCDESAIQRAQRKAPALTAYLEQQLNSEGFLFAEGPMLCDMAIAGIFRHAAYAGFHVDGGQYPRLACYLERVWQTPLFTARLREEADMLAMFFGH